MGHYLTREREKDLQMRSWEEEGLMAKVCKNMVERGWQGQMLDFEGDRKRSVLKIVSFEGVSKFVPAPNAHVSASEGRYQIHCGHHFRNSGVVTKGAHLPLRRVCTCFLPCINLQPRINHLIYNIIIKLKVKVAKSLLKIFFYCLRSS